METIKEDYKFWYFTKKDYKTRLLGFDTAIDPFSVWDTVGLKDKFIQDLYDDNRITDIQINLSSFGGNFEAALDISKELAAYSAKGAKINILIDGVSGNAVPIILAANGTITAHKSSIMMIGEPIAVIHGNVLELTNAYNKFLSDRETFIQQMVQKTKIERETMIEYMRKRKWFRGDELFTGGIADKMQEDEK